MELAWSSTHPLTFASSGRPWRRFIDPKTASKVFLLSGDISSGSQNDDLMNNVIGSEWKQLTGAGRPTLSTPFSPKARKNINASPGFDIDVYWPTVLRREEAWAKCAAEKLAVKSDPVPAAPVASPSSPKRRLSIGSPLKMGPWKGVVKGGDRYLRQQSAPQQQIRAPVPSPISRKVPQQEPIKKTKQDEAEAESEAETEGGAASTRNSWSVEAKLGAVLCLVIYAWRCLILAKREAEQHNKRVGVGVGDGVIGWGWG